METTSGLLRPPPPAVRDARRSLTWSWSRLALPTLLALTAVAYLWDLSSSGYANSFYAAAVQAGTKSWKAFFFGSIDSVELHHRRQAAGVAVGDGAVRPDLRLLAARACSSRRRSRAWPPSGCSSRRQALVRRGRGLLAGALLAATPVAALMFRFNNPDALLVLLLVAAAYCLVRALEGGATRWMVAAGTLLGFAFLAKMTAGVPGRRPAFALVYLVAAPVGAAPPRRGSWLAGGGGDRGRAPAGGWRSSRCGRSGRGR